MLIFVNLCVHCGFFHQASSYHLGVVKRCQYVPAKISKAHGAHLRFSLWQKSWLKGVKTKLSNGYIDGFSGVHLRGSSKEKRF